MGATWLRFRADVRRRWRAWLVLAVLAGLAGGAVIASLAGARRTDTAFERFQRWSNAIDVSVFTGATELDVDAIKSLPEVEEAFDAFFVWLVGENGVSDLDPVYVTSVEVFERVDRTKVLAGRRPRLDRVEEASITPAAARLTGLGVGSSVTLRALRPDQLEEAFSGTTPEPAGPTITFRIVGIEASQSGFLQDATIHLTPAFGRTYGGQVATIPLLGVKLRNGAADLGAFTAGIESLSEGAQNHLDSLEDAAADVNRSVHVQAVALRLFAVLAALAAGVILSQALMREASGQVLDQPVLRAVGMTMPQFVAGALLRSLAIGLVAALAAVVVALLASPFVLFGLARDVDPSPGVSFDAAIVPAGAAVLVLLTALAGTLAGWRAASRRGEEAVTRVNTLVRPSRLVSVFARAGAPPSVVVGVRMALEPGGGRSAVPTAAALVGTALSLAALVTALTFGASLHRLYGTPSLYGWNWDAVVGSPFDVDVSEKAVPALLASPAVAEFSAISSGGVTVEGKRVRAFGFDTVQGSVLPPILEGREPRRPDEIVLGTRTLRHSGRPVGASVDVRFGNQVTAMRVVGRAVFPSIGEGDEAGPGEGALLTHDSLRRLVGEVPVNLFAVRFSDHAAGDAEDQLGIGRELGIHGAEPPKSVADLRRVDALPDVLSGLLILLAAGSLAHTLVSGVRRRRRDLAVLKTIGFVRRQVRGIVAWQASALAMAALLCGIPLGVAGGRWLWRVFADGLGIVPEPVVPLLALLVVTPATLLAANLLAAPPGRSAARTRPALVLRSE